jgi:hypothetical protein
LGTVDNFDKSLHVVKRFLSPLYEHLDISYVAQNVSTSLDSNSNIDLKINKLKAEFGEVVELAERFNDLDIRLWSACNNEIERRYAYCKV